MNFTNDTDVALIGSMTGSKFLAHTRDLAMDEQEGRTLTKFERDQVNRAVEIYGPEYFYMDGEIFA